MRTFLLVLLGLFVLSSAALAAEAPAFQLLPIDEAWRAALPLDPVAATEAWLGRIPPEVRARSDAYVEGGYWLQLWNLLLGFLIAWLMLRGHWATAVRDRARARLRSPFWADAAYGAFFLVVSWLLGLPLTVYQGFVREHAYGMATQGLGAWFAEQLTQLAISTALGGLLVGLLYLVLRRAGARWWLWGAVVMSGVMAVMVAVSPVLIEPLFNTYQPMAEGPLKSALLHMAQANGVPTDNVYVYDASRQTTRVSANVSGLFGSAAVRLNDNLLRRASPAEVRSVMAHEIGHYAMHHVGKMLVFFGLVIAACFLATDRAMQALLRRGGAGWRVQGIADVGGLPLLAAVISAFMILATPVTNTIVRTQETEADLWGLNLAREPLAEAEVLLKLVEYRKADPGPLEEFLFFDHPSARTRIFNAMRWRAQLAGAAP